jgi:RNA polymerase sigma-70 factor, ECF subfamily
VKEASDERLMEAIAGGDIDSLGEIVTRYQQLAWSVAYRLLNDRMEAEDAAQEVFIRVLDAAPRYRPEGSFRTYLYQILTRLCIDRLRKKRPTSVETVPDLADPSAGPVDRLLAKERESQVRRALDALPLNQRTALILRHYENLSYAEIAQVMSLTRKAVERLIARAGTSLQARLSHLQKS